MVPLRRILATVGFTCVAGAAAAQLRVGTWNISNYDGATRFAAIQIAVYQAYQGRFFRPDVILAQEFISASALATFVNALNTAPNSPGDWAAAPFVDGADTDQILVYRQSKLDLLATVTVAIGSSAPSNQPRNTMRYDMQLEGYSGPGGTISLYCSHMKAGSFPDDVTRRLVEAQRIRDDAEALPVGRHFLLGADFNIPASSESSYQELVGSQSNNAGRFFDPISSPGSWGASTFRFIHTQDPAGGGGMDDRFDQILLSAGLIDGDGFDYIGNPATPYSTTTWNDLNHSYRAWGNDGSTYNQALKISGNTMVGSIIAQAIVDCAAGAGHIPVFLDLRVPPKLGPVVGSLEFGKVRQHAKPVARSFTIQNTGDVALWTETGIAALNYQVSLPSGYVGAAGPFSEAAGGGANLHTVWMDTRTPGYKIGFIQIATNAPETPFVTIQVSGYVFPITR